MAEARRRLVYGHDRWEVDLARRELRAHGAPVPIGGRAFEIMELLVRSAGALVTKNDMMAHVWPGAAIGENTLHVHISAVRKALGPDRNLLKTASGRGYRMLGDWTPRAENEDGVAPISVAEGASSAPIPAFVSNLGLSGTPLIGRADTVRYLLDLLSAYRAVTLTGPGGIGKTRLSLEVARDLFPDFGGDAWLVDLVWISDPALVPSTVASTLGLNLAGAEASPLSIAAAIGERKLLLILDNCEHVIDTTAGVAEAILRTCPNVSILSTSRELLRIDGEFAFRVPALDVPLEARRNADSILAHSAVQLFIARMKALTTEGAIEEPDLLAIAAICRRLDGMPLAIELAAARAASLGSQQVLARLDDRFSLLTGGRRTALPRHQTLRATLDWSYEMLAQPEQLLLRALGVFPAGFTLEAAVGVAGGADFPAPRIEAAIANLVERSLVDIDKSHAAARWRLLETTRAYALEKLAEAGEAEAVTRRQAQFFCDMFYTAMTSPKPSPLGESLSRAIREIGNVRAALDWAFSPGGDSAIGVHLTAAYVPVWLGLSLIDECLARGREAVASLERQALADPHEKMQLLSALGWQQMSGVPVEGGTAAWRAVLEIAEEIGDIDHQLKALWALWVDCKNTGVPRDGLALAERFNALAVQASDPSDRFVGERLRGVSLHLLGNHAEARVCIERMLEHYLPPADLSYPMRFQFDQKAMARNALARISWAQGHPGQALQEIRENIQHTIDIGHQLSLSNVLAEVACPIAFLVGDLDLCARYTTQLQEETQAQALDVWKAFAECFGGDLLIRRGDLTAGIDRLRGGIERLRRTNFVFHHTAFLSALASGLAKAGRPDKARSAIDEALAQCARTGEGWFLPELHRVKGEIAIAADPGSGPAAEAAFAQALNVARAQGAASWELRAGTSLAKLWSAEGKIAAARDLLAPIYAGFSKDLDTPDLAAAAAVLEAC